MAGSKTCPKCSGRMGEGHVVDMGYGSVTPARWQSGLPRRTWFGNIKVNKRELRDVVAYRCDRCGYLENYVT